MNLLRAILPVPAGIVIAWALLLPTTALAADPLPAVESQAPIPIARTIAANNDGATTAPPSPLDPLPFPTSTLTPATSSPPALSAASLKSDTLDDRHKLAIGDRVSFQILEDEEDSKPLIVTDLGELDIPYIGRFPALGKTCRELAKLLKDELEKEYYYQATVLLSVDVMALSRGMVYLDGPVRAPGTLELPSNETLTVSKAIMRAGGFGDFADRKRVRVIRESKVPGQPDLTFVIDVAEILEKGKSDKDLALEPGDVIKIPERLVRF